MKRPSTQAINTVLLALLVGHGAYMTWRVELLKQDVEKATKYARNAEHSADMAYSSASDAENIAKEAFDAASEARDYAYDASENAYFKHCRYCVSGY